MSDEKVATSIQSMIIVSPIIRKRTNFLQIQLGQYSLSHFGRYMIDLSSHIAEIFMKTIWRQLTDHLRL
jgi:hypothetical protein